MKQQGTTKPIYRSRVFLLGLIGFLGVLGVWVDSCRYATAWQSHIIPKRVATSFGMMQGTVGVGVHPADATPVYVRRERHGAGFGPELATMVSWSGDRAMMQIRVWKLVAMYLAYWSAVMAWRVWRYHRVARAARAV